MRQQEDSETRRSREVLHNLRFNEAMESDSDFLNPCSLCQLPADSRPPFVDALHLCPTNELVMT